MVPYDSADNPVMSVVAFLAGIVSPGVAAEAAKTALKELTDGEGGKAISGDSKDGESTEKKVDDDKMDKDAPVVKDASTADGILTSTPTLPRSTVQRAAHLALSTSAKAVSTLASAEPHNIRNTLSTLIKLTLTKLENKMTQFEELEEILGEERRNLEIARVALVNERLGLKKTLDSYSCIA
ncbi:hypothetical protein P691DRAFT_768654 [Macrolepiota fuliginosa MF-IS2]|uniref:SMARCC C-terminal domain-containing protein n=1 Tax=Macrolepiota fuliginosa MF-IS2 TaxID=1400762 RepID=A0A9P6BVZ0_9AGAR|nr:hypothetical protein P691DRAFT_768654 [Macrolepiota fuliginosa MF-IS2]